MDLAAVYAFMVKRLDSILVCLYYSTVIRQPSRSFSLPLIKFGESENPPFTPLYASPLFNEARTQK